MTEYNTFTQKEALTYTGSAAEFAITLDRGNDFSIQKIEVTAAMAEADASIQVCRKDSATSANERTSSHSDSDGVLWGDFHLSTGLPFQRYDNSDLTALGLRLYMSLGSTAHTVYVNITYAYTQE